MTACHEWSRVAGELQESPNMSILQQPTTPEPLEADPDQQRPNNVSLCVWVEIKAAQPCSASSCGPSQPLNTSIPGRLCNRCAPTKSIIVNADRAAADDPRVTRLQVINSVHNLSHRTDAVGQRVTPPQQPPLPLLLIDLLQIHSGQCGSHTRKQSLS